MHRTIFCTLLTTAISFQPASSLAQTAPSGTTGGSQSFDNFQPSLALNYFIPTQGTFPSRSGSNPSEMLLGNVRMFAGNFVPGGSLSTDGRLLNIANNSALFSLLGTTYGGDGRTTFALPDLRGRTAVHAGTGPGLTRMRLGEKPGNATVTLTQNQLPAHAHALPAPANTTGATGASQPFDNRQPSLGLNYLINISNGLFPSRSGGSSTGGQAFLGQVSLFAGNFAPAGWALADGQLLPISQFQALFSLMGTTYSGDGRTTFALPDLRGRTPVHAGTGPGLSRVRLGEKLGSDNITLTQAQMPSHNHSVPPETNIPVTVTDPAGGGQLFDNRQPGLGINHIIALSGIFPSTSGQIGGETVLGEIALFAGNFAPAGWAFADGQLLSISQSSALFSLLGTTYGGDGRTTFALPDLRGRTAIDAGSGPLGNFQLGQKFGNENVTLTESQLPAHSHSVPIIPEPSTLAFVIVSLFATLSRRRKHSR